MMDFEERFNHVEARLRSELNRLGFDANDRSKGTLTRFGAALRREAFTDALRIVREGRVGNLAPRFEDDPS